MTKNYYTLHHFIIKKFEFEPSRHAVKSEKGETKKKQNMSSRRPRCPCSKGVTIFLKKSSHSVEDTHDMLFKLVDNDCAKCMDRVLSKYVFRKRSKIRKHLNFKQNTEPKYPSMILVMSATSLYCFMLHLETEDVAFDLCCTNTGPWWIFSRRRRW